MLWSLHISVLCFLVVNDIDGGVRALISEYFLPVTRMLLVTISCTCCSHSWRVVSEG